MDLLQLEVKLTPWEAREEIHSNTKAPFVIACWQHSICWTAVWLVLLNQSESQMEGQSMVKKAVLLSFRLNEMR